MSAHKLTPEQKIIRAALKGVGCRFNNNEIVQLANHFDLKYKADRDTADILKELLEQEQQ